MVENENITQANTNGDVDTDATTETPSTETEGSPKVPDPVEAGLDKTLLSEKEGDPKEPKTDEPKDPIVYEDFSFPENIEINNDLMEKFKGLAQDSSLSQEKAQALLDLSIENGQKVLADQQAEFMKVRQDWQKSIKEDPDFGGKNFSETIVRAKRVLNNYGSPELKEMLDTSGLGDNPEVIKMFVKIDKVLGDDTSVTGQAGSTLSTAQKIYDKSKHN